MFKVGIFSDEISQDFEYALRVIRKLGVGYVELRTMWGKNLVNLSSNELKRVKELIKKCNLRVSNIASPVFKCHFEEKEIKGFPGNSHLMEEKDCSEHLEILEYSFELAKMFETSIVRVFSFWRKGDLTEEILDEIAKKFEVPIKRAEEENIILALENEYSCSIGNGAESRQFLDRISSKNIGLIWDPGNAYFLGETPYPDGYELIKVRVVHVHIKDAGKNNKGRPIWLPVGKGEIDFKGQIQALSKDNFSGVISLETHCTLDGSQEKGTRESFSGMQSILRSLRIASYNI